MFPLNQKKRVYFCPNSHIQMSKLHSTTVLLTYKTRTKKATPIGCDLIDGYRNDPIASIISAFSSTSVISIFTIAEGLI